LNFIFIILLYFLFYLKYFIIWIIQRKRDEEEEEDNDNKLESPKKHRFINFRNPISLQNTVTPVKNAVKNSYNLVKTQLIRKYPTEFYQKFVGGDPTLNETLWCSDNSRYKLLMIVGNQNKKVYEVNIIIIIIKYIFINVKIYFFFLYCKPNHYIIYIYKFLKKRFL